MTLQVFARLYDEDRPIRIPIPLRITTDPSRSRELERLGLDYCCCCGKRTLSEACQQQNLDPVAVLDQLVAQSADDDPPPEWIGMAPPRIGGPAGDHPSPLPQAGAAKAQRAGTQGGPCAWGKHPDLLRVAEIDSEICADLEPHLRKEEEVLVPLIRTLSTGGSRPEFHCGSIVNPIAVLEQERTEVGALLERMWALTNGYQAPAGTCASTRSLMEGLAALEADTDRHVHNKNNHLLPAALALEKAMAS